MINFSYNSALYGPLNAQKPRDISIIAARVTGVKLTPIDDSQDHQIVNSIV